MTMDDLAIWSLYERNSSHYFTCKGQDLAKCPNLWDKESEHKICWCYRDQIVLPITIGERQIDTTLDTDPEYRRRQLEQSLNRRSYICIGESCSICMDSVIHKRNAWITYCGHAYHRTCLVQYYHSYMKRVKPYTNCVPCPLCRAEIPTCCTGIDVSRYQCRVKNELDVLENIHVTFDLLFPAACYKCDKWVGMNKHCKICLKFREGGIPFMCLRI